MADDKEEVDFDDVQVRKLKLVDDDDDETQEQQAAISAIKAKIAAEPSNADLHAQLGQLYQNLEMDDEAEESFAKAIELNPSKVSFYQLKAAVYTATSQYDEAEETLKKALSLEPNNAGLLYDLGKLYQLDEEHKKAVDAFEQAVAKNATHATSLYELARYAQNDKNTDKALNLFRQVIAADGNNVNAYSAAGQILQDRKTADDLKEAAQYFSKAVALSSADVQLRARLIQCYDAIGLVNEREQARAQLHDAFQKGTLNPQYKVRPRYCCSQFEAGDKFVMAFDYSKPEGQNHIKYSFNAYKKGEVHEDKVVMRVNLESDGSKFQLVVDKPDRRVEASFDAEPSFQVVKEHASKIIAA